MNVAHFAIRLVASLLVAPAVVAAAQASTSQDLLSNFTSEIEALRTDLIDIRRDIHRHPDVSGQEERTAGLVATRLRAAGFEVRTGIGGHGVVGLLRGSGPGPVLAFRADMDAVRSNTTDPVDFPSKIEGVRHICGHDIHTTVGLALAEGFSAVRTRLRGSVMLIFQPAEERATGARAMLADGVFADLTPDAVFAYHTAPMEVGQVAIARETQMPGRDGVRVDVRGEGDLEAIARAIREVVLKTGTLTAREALTPTSEPFVLVQGARANRATSGWAVTATLTTSSRDVSRGARQAIEQGLTELERDGLTLTLNYQERLIAGVTNDPALVDAANISARAVLGDDAVLAVQSLVPTFSEDFGAFQEDVPGAMYFLGVSNAERGWVGMPHSPGYVADEESIFLGARAMAAVFFGFFENGLPGSGR